MNYHINYNQYHSIFAVPTAVVEEHIKLCGGVQLKALLILLSSGPELPSSAQIAEKLCLSEGDIQDALGYWVSAGILTAENAESAAAPVCYRPVPEAQPVPSPVSEQPKAEPAPKERVQILTDKPRLTRSEAMQMIRSNQQLSQLLEEVQNALGKTLTSVEMDTVVALYSYYGLAADFILMVIYYCKSIGKANMRYVEKTAASWVDQGIDTHEKAEKHISRLTEKNEHEALVRSAFGIYDRKLISKEEKFIDTWFDQYHFDIDIIKLAYERTIENIGKPSFAYINSILTSWHEKGYTTAREAADDIAAGSEKSAAIGASYNAQDLQKQILADFMTGK